MTSEKVDMTLGMSLVMNDIINALLYTRKTGEDGNPIIVDRDLPFKLRYRLNKNRVLFEKDAQFFNQQRLLALAKYGEATADGKGVAIVDDAKKEAFKNELGNMLDSIVSHSIVRLDPEDLDLVTDTDITISPDAMNIFISYMTDDTTLIEDLSTPVRLVSPQETKEVKQESKIEETPAATETPEETKTWNLVTENPETENPVKETKKTSTTKKTTSATTKKSESKTTTPKKPRAKKTEAPKEA